MDTAQNTDSLQTAVPTGHREDQLVHSTSQQRRSRVSWSPGGILFSTVVLFLVVSFAFPFPLVVLLIYVVVGGGDCRWLLGTLAHWCACQTARRHTAVGQAPPPHPNICLSTVASRLRACGRASIVELESVVGLGVTTLLCVALFCVRIQEYGMQIRPVIQSIFFALYQPCDAYLLGIKWFVKGV